MIMVRATRDTEAEEVGPVPDQQLMADMASYHEELAKAGVLLDGASITRPATSAPSPTARSPRPRSWSPATR
jgi:hypothetical protein